MTRSEFEKYSNIARHITKAPMVFKGANIVNVFTEQIIRGDIAVCDGFIVGIGDYSSDNEIDVTGRYIIPGMIDSHLHLESTLVTPAELISQAAACGTTTFIVDPHESANVSGSDGIDYILEQTSEAPANVYVMMPSCVPATSLDDNGCIFTHDMMKPYLNNRRILGLGEVMDYFSVVTAENKMYDKLELFRDKIIDGHAPFLKDDDLQAYVMAGISTDHECCDYEYAMKERANGLTVLIREGSAAKNLEAIVSGIVANDTPTDGFCFCTDDKHIEDIKKLGHINYSVKKAISLGINPVKAIKMATIQAAKCYNLHNIGAIAAGYQADLVIVDNLSDFNIIDVYHKGRKINKNQKVDIKPCKPGLKNTMHIAEVSRQQLSMPSGRQMIIEMIPGQITTKAIESFLPGEEEFQPNDTFKKIVAVERHKSTGLVGVGAVTGFGIRNGAIASSVSHDSHNIIAIGDNDDDILFAIEELNKCGGGYIIVSNGKVEGLLALPIMGLISDAGYEQVNVILADMITTAHNMGVAEDMEPFITLSFMALPVIPQIRITPRGIIQV